MTQTFDVLASATVQQHLNRNPRVIAFRDLPGENGHVWEVEYNPDIAVPAVIAHEAKSLALRELAMPPKC